MPSCLKTGNVIFPKFPTPIERKLLDLPLPDDDDGLAIPPFDSLNPFGSRAAPSSPRLARDGGDVRRLRRRPPLIFIDLTKRFEDALGIACIVIVFAVAMAMLP